MFKSLRNQFNSIVVLSFLSLLTITWLLSQHLIDSTSEQWAYQFAQRQVQFDKHRTLLPLIREIALARQLAATPEIIEFAQDASNPAKEKAAISTLERYRQNFKDQSYFAAIRSTGHYYHNNSKDEYRGKELRYQLKPGKPQDQWFFSTIQSNLAYSINVDPDVELGVTKVWINVLVQKDGKTLGLVGTGLDIQSFIAETVNIKQTGVRNLFIDQDLAIQIDRDLSLIDYAGITKGNHPRKTIHSLFSRPDDIQHLKEAMEAVARNPAESTTLWVRVNTEDQLLGVAYLPEIGWYDLTLIDTQVLFKPLNLFAIPLTFTLLLLIVTLIIHRFFSESVQRPISALVAASARLQKGDFNVSTAEVAQLPNEMGQVGRAFESMRSALHAHANKLELLVQERTKELAHLTEELELKNKELLEQGRTDALTGLLNRYGMNEAVVRETNHVKRSHKPCGIVMLDIDHFKNVNDQHGHLAGDVVLKELGKILTTRLRSVDIVSRWGGEEFLILLPDTDLQASFAVAEFIRVIVESATIIAGDVQIQFTISLGVSEFPSSTEASWEDCIKRADNALYQAKASGRNKVCV